MGVIDDDIFEEDEYFYVHLSNPRVIGYPEIGAAPLDASATPKAVMGDNHTATVTIYDDDHAGAVDATIIKQELSKWTQLWRHNTLSYSPQQDIGEQAGERGRPASSPRVSRVK